MSTIINARSPYYFKVSNADLDSVKLELYIWTGTHSQRTSAYLRYTISKDQRLDELDRGTTTSASTGKLIDSTQNFQTTAQIGSFVKNTTDNTTASVTNIDSDTQLDLNSDIMASGENYILFAQPYVVFELSELIRDYLETEYNDYATDAVWVDADVTIYNSAGSIVQVNSQNTNTTTFLGIDGYGYFEDGVNPRDTSTPMILQDNTNVFYYDGQDIKIPVFAEAATITVSLQSQNDADIDWNVLDDFWETNDNTWGSGDVAISITDNGNTNQKIQYVIIEDTEDLEDGDTVTFSSVKDSGTTTSAATNKLIQTGQNFETTVRVGDLVENTTDSTTATVTAVDSDTQLTLSSDIMASDENYNIKYEANKVITLKKVNECKFSPLNTIFYNKYGALQNMWFFKKSTTNINVKSEQFKNNILDLENSGGTPSYALSKHQEKKFMVNAKESITMNTGFYPEAHNEIVRQMLLSEQVWSDDISNVLPINLKSNTLQFKKSVNDKLITYTVQFDYAFDKINNIL
jgi:hypothetical protein|tara:strand:+ start:111 stop:1667 length:1557 start_codon:yes stop_codon:yes gene_type:complete